MSGWAIAWRRARAGGVGDPEAATTPTTGTGEPVDLSSPAWSSQLVGPAGARAGDSYRGGESGARGEHRAGEREPWASEGGEGEGEGRECSSSGGTKVGWWRWGGCGGPC